MFSVTQGRHPVKSKDSSASDTKGSQHSPASTSISQTLLPTKPLPPSTTTFVPAGADFGEALANARSGAAAAVAIPSIPTAKDAGTVVSRVRRSICPEGGEEGSGGDEDVSEFGDDDMWKRFMLLMRVYDDDGCIGIEGTRNELQHAMVAARNITRSMVRIAGFHGQGNVQDAYNSTASVMLDHNEAILL